MTVLLAVLVSAIGSEGSLAQTQSERRLFGDARDCSAWSWSSPPDLALAPALAANWHHS